MAEHRRHVAEVLQRLREYQLFLKAEKCTFHLPSVQFLGYNISSGGIQMDEGKVKAIREWPTPDSIKALQRFLGFANFYWRFIKDFSIITSPLTNLLKEKPKSLKWSPAATKAFQELKEAFTQAPILVHPDPEKQFIVKVPNLKELHHVSTPVPSSPGNSARRSATMTLGTGNFWPSSSHWKSGGTG
jgi:hypothetical protein